MASERAQLVARVLERKWEDMDEQSVAEHIEAAFQTEREEARKPAAVEACMETCLLCKERMPTLTGMHYTGISQMNCMALGIREHFGLGDADFLPREETEKKG